MAFIMPGVFFLGGGPGLLPALTRGMHPLLQKCPGTTRYTSLWQCLLIPQNDCRIGLRLVLWTCVQRSPSETVVQDRLWIDDAKLWVPGLTLF